MPENAIVLDSIFKRYPQSRVAAADNISLQIPQSDFVAVLGPSGSGKSTLLNIMGGIESPDKGTLFIMNKKMNRTAWPRVRQRMIGFVFQDFQLFPTLTAVENVEIPMFGVLKNRKARRKRALELLEQVGLGPRASHHPFELSGGECQRVAIARSLANAPQILLADEPTGNLDSKTSLEIVSVFKNIHVLKKTTLVVVTHDAHIAEQASLVIGLKDGCITSLKRNNEICLTES